MSPSSDPAALLPLAVVGLVIGASLALGSGYGLHLQWSRGQGASASPAQVPLEGRIEWAGWRASAVPDGPSWYLEVRLADRPRGFLVAAESLSDWARARFGSPAADQGIPALTGEQATVVVDSSLLGRPERHPYLAALRVDGQTIVPQGGEAGDESMPWIRRGLGLLLGVGVLVGVGVVGASLQHVVVCIRQRRGAS